MKKDLFTLMAEHSLTLRRLSATESSSYMLPNNATQEEIERSHEVILREMDEESFKRMKEKGFFQNCAVFRNGFVIGRMVREVVQRESGWLVKIDSSHGSTQKWSRKGDFFGKTPEEAINKAVEYCEKRTKERQERMRRAGILS